MEREVGRTVTSLGGRHRAVPDSKERRTPHGVHGCMALDMWYRTTEWRERKPVAAVHWLYQLTARDHVYIYIYLPTDRILLTTTFVIPVVQHWLERDIIQ